jgi:hypothetical protein
MRNKSKDFTNISNLNSINFKGKNVINFFCKTLGNCLIFKLTKAQRIYELLADQIRTF